MWLRVLKQFYPSWQPERLRRAMELFQPEDKSIHEFSVGMRRCLAFAFAFGIDPAIYILDEPTAGLDIIARKILLDPCRRRSPKWKGCNPIHPYR